MTAGARNLTWKPATPKATPLPDNRTLLEFPSGHRHIAHDLDPAQEWEEAIDDLGCGLIDHLVRFRRASDA
jgi:hypothetical protein